MYDLRGAKKRSETKEVVLRSLRNKLTGLVSCTILLGVLTGFIPLLHSQGPTPHRATLTWVSGGASPVTTGYRVYRKQPAAASYTQIGQTGASTLTYVDTTGVGGVQYIYAVSAFNVTGESGPLIYPVVTFIGNPPDPLLGQVVVD